jgi:hypothetical protein
MILRLTTPELKNVQGPFRSGWQPVRVAQFRLRALAFAAIEDLELVSRVGRE